MSTATYPSPERLAHLKSHLDGGLAVERKVAHIRNGTGNVLACLEGLAGHATASALQAWFSQHDLQATRGWFRQAAALDRMRCERRRDAFGPGDRALRLLRPLVADDDELIDWFAHCDDAYDMARVRDPRTIDFWAYQAVLALRGEWGRLEARCEQVLALPAGSPGLQHYRVDHRFYRGLARGDERAMRSALAEIVQPQVVAARRHDESGYTDGLIFTPGVIYAKMARRRGWHIEPVSPLIPAQWLPVEQPPAFVSVYDFEQASCASRDAAMHQPVVATPTP